MSDGDVIVISSDEDSDLVVVSEENEHNGNSEAAQTSNEELQKYEANETCFIGPAKSSVNPTAEGTGKEMCINQSDHSCSISIKTKYTPDSIEIIENNLYGNESETFKKFMSIVLTVEQEEKSKAKLVKKLSKYHKLADPSYIKSLEFSELLEKGIEKINKNSVYLYFVLKEVKDCLISSRVEFKYKKNATDKILRSGESARDTTSQENNLGNEDLTDANEDERKYKIVKKLTSLLIKVGEKIKELEEMEVDFSDEEDSSYFKMQRYRERYCQVYDKLCTYTSQPLNGIRIGGVRKINFSGTDNLELNRAIEKWLNKTKQFPDYSDVNKFMDELNQSLSLKLTKEQVKIRAQQIFEKIGNMLQRRRHFDLWDSLSSFLTTDVDPAVKDPELASVLKKNFELGIKKEKELLNYYVEKQERDKLQPREVPDDEANCSPTESGDEDEKEIEIVENMLDSKISTDDDEDDNENEEKSDEESDRDPVCRSDSKIIEEGSIKMDVMPKTQVKSHDHQTISVSNDNCNRVNDVGRNGTDSRVWVNSEQTETAGTNNGAISVKDENVVGAIPSKQYMKDNPVVWRPNILKKRKNENINENNDENVNIHPYKRFLEEKEMKQTTNFKETKIINKSDSDSDCEIVNIISSKKDESNKAQSSERKVYQINYAFINNTFNYNSVLSSNIFRKRHCFLSNYKNVKNHKSFNDLPLNDLTNIESITNKYAWYKENKMKRKLKNFFNKAKLPNSLNWQAPKGSDLKNNDLAISMGKNIINCPLNQEKSAENVNSQKDVNKTNQNDDSQGSSNETAAPPPSGGSSSGGNGQDNSDNNGNKKPFDRETQTEDSQENEEKEEDEEEDTDNPEGKVVSQRPKVIDAPPKLPIPRTETHQSEQKASGGAIFKMPPTERVVPGRRKSFGKQWEKPSGSEVVIKKEPLISLPLARSPRAKPSSVRKRKVNQNSGAQGTARQGNRNTSAVQFKRFTLEPKKPIVNKPIPTAPTSRDDDIEIIQVTKKKRTAPVKSAQSDEEIVKNFLERSHPSISITTPKKKAVQKEPPPSVRQALETLSRLKGISTTIVKGSSKQNTDEEVTIISESLNTRIKKISKKPRTPAPSTVTSASTDPTLPRIVTVQGNVAGFDDIVDDSTVIRDDYYHEYVQNPQAPLANVSGNTSNYNENFFAPQARSANVSGGMGHYDENFYGPQARSATVSGSASHYDENFYGPQAPTASVPGSASNIAGNFYGPQLPTASTSGSASGYEEHLYGPQAPAASVSGTASNYEENFTGTVECIPIPRFRNVRSRSRRTPKKTKNIEYVILE